MPLTPTPLAFEALRIADVRRETDDAVSLAFEVPDSLRARFAYTPGQYLTLRATVGGEEVRRSYSICSGLDDGEIRVAVKHVPDGLFSAHANTVFQIGDIVDVMPPAGRFGLGAASAPVILALAAGSGITPILSILKTALVRDPHARCILLYGSRGTASILFRGALEDLKDRFLGRLTVIHVLSREAQDVAVLNGRLDGAKLRALLPSLADPGEVGQALICGPADMIDDLTETLADLGIPPTRIHSERFVPSADASRPRRVTPVPTTAAPFAIAAIVHEGKTTEVPVAAGEAVLDAALRAGLDLPWSCRAGMCSTCRARVSHGGVEMTQNFSLEPWETEAGYVLTCQAVPTTARLTVDYDQV